jgi:long-chain acyl-CoA synthetase
MSLGLGSVLRERGRSYPAHIALVCGDDRYTYSEFNQRVNRIANFMKANDVGAGQRVVWLGLNCHRFLEVLFACSKVGAIFVPISWRLELDEVSQLLQDANPSLAFWSQSQEVQRPTLVSRLAPHGTKWIAYDDGGAAGYEALIQRQSSREPEDQIDIDSPVLQIYTSAFSGKARGAVISHRAIVMQDLVIAWATGIYSTYAYLNCGPLYHVGTLMNTLATAHVGGKNVFMPRVDADRICQLIEAESCNGAFIVEPTISQIVDLNRDGHYNLKSLRSIPGRPEWNQMTTVDPLLYRGGYGQTELMGMLTLGYGAETFSGLHGRTSPMAELKIVDEDGVDVEPGTPGEIATRGPLVMTAYSNQPDATRGRLRQGWYLTNDLGVREPDGSITFIGSKTRLIKSGNENIYPAEVEACLRSHPSVRDCAVIGVPDVKWTQSVVAIVVLKTSQRATEQELVDYCRIHIASYKKPRMIRFEVELPRTNGLVDYAALDERYGGGGYPGAPRS